MTTFQRSDQRANALRWAHIWFKQFAAFHRRNREPQWSFTADEVIRFSRYKRDKGVPAWKRRNMVRGLIAYRREVQQRDADDLKPIERKLREIAARERAREEGCDDIEEVVGKIDPREPDIIQDFRRALRRNGKKYGTERAYVGKLKAFMRARGLKCRNDFTGISGADIESHLTDLAVDGNVAPSTQNQAFHALRFLFEYVLKRDMGHINAIRAHKGKQIPTVLSESEVARILSQLRGVHLTIGQLLYGCGLRISEALRLRVKDIDFENGLIEIHQSKGGKSRLVPLPKQLVDPLKRQLRSRRVLHDKDVEEGMASVWLPHALAKKYPSAKSEWRWQFLFASDKHSRDPRTGKLHRHHLHRDTFPRHLRQAVEDSGIDKAVTSHVFRHSFATHLLRVGTDIRTIQELLGHSDVATTMIYTHVLNRDDAKVVSPLDRLGKHDAGREPITDGDDGLAPPMQEAASERISNSREREAAQSCRQARPLEPNISPTSEESNRRYPFPDRERLIPNLIAPDRGQNPRRATRRSKRSIQAFAVRWWAVLLCLLVRGSPGNG